MKTIKTFFLAIVFISLLLQVSFADRYETLHKELPISIAANEVALVVFVSCGDENRNAGILYQKDGTQVIRVNLSPTDSDSHSDDNRSNGSPSVSNPLPLAGPAKLSVHSSDSTVAGLIIVENELPAAFMPNAPSNLSYE